VDATPPRPRSEWTLFINGIETDVYVVVDENEFFVPIEEVSLLFGWVFENHLDEHGGVQVSWLDINMWYDESQLIFRDDVPNIQIQSLILDRTPYRIDNGRKWLILGGEPTTDPGDGTTPPPVGENVVIDLSRRGINNTRLTEMVASGEIPANVTSLNLFENQISDISSLSGLTNLRYLNLNENQVSDLTALSNMTYLDELSLAGNTISNLTPLSGLRHLRDLYIVSDQLNDVTPLYELTSLRMLAIGVITQQQHDALVNALPNTSVNSNMNSGR
jgi:Leucine-rich repeat (LRR) protein